MIKTLGLTRNWLRALTLLERCATLQPVSHPYDAASIASSSPRASRWSSQPPFDVGFPFSRRLAVDGLTRETFEQIVNEPLEDLEARFPETPSWVSCINEAWESDTFSDSIGWSAFVTEHDLYGFIQAIEPLIIHYRNELQRGAQTLVKKYGDVPFNPQAIGNMMIKPLADHIFPMASRTLVLELNAARLRGQLSGETPQERYRQFFEQLREPENIFAFLDEYVVLARQITTYLSDWLDSSLEFLDRLCADWDVIQSTFSPDEATGKLTQLDSGLGDLHGGGRTVAIAHFDSGLRVVYKPRPQSIALHFQQLLAWLNAHDLPHPFRVLKVFDGGSYGWMEFVDAETCETFDEVTRFYQRQGGYLALLYVLAGTDVHAENLIAAGEHPVLIDVETLFHPALPDASISEWDRPVLDVLYTSVLRSLLLPLRMYADDQQGGIDISGLGAKNGQFTPMPVPSWEGAGTDEMHLAHKPTLIPDASNRPTLNGQELDLADYLAPIVAGFETVYRLLIQHKDEFLSGPLAAFADDVVRVVLRPTRTYAFIQNEGYHPNLLRDALTRDRLFDYLWRQIPRQPELMNIVAYEKTDLQRSNIPLFTGRPNSRDLWSSGGNRIVNFFAETTMVSAQKRVRALSEKDMQNQSWLIRASFLALPLGASKSNGVRHDPMTTPSIFADSVEPQLLLAVAQAAGARLESLALHNEKYVNWVGLTSSINQYEQIVPLGIDLYNGLPGVILFLAQLGATTTEQRYTHLAEKALVTLQAQIDAKQQHITSIGAFNGWGGLLYTYTHLAALWERQDLFDAAMHSANRISDLVKQDASFDIVGGAAGSIASLLSLYHCIPSDRLLEVAIQCGDHLSAKAKVIDGGLGWLTHPTSSMPITGFAHGTAGIVWALSALADATQEERFRAMIPYALPYERGAFSPEFKNWHSLRSSIIDREHDNPVAWCYGAGGIGLARLTMHHTDDQFQTEIETALRTTLARGFGENHSLCHGDLGNIELLLQASHKLDSGYWEAHVNSLTRAILDSISEHGWVGGDKFVTAPGLMTGIAGIGYGLLRLADPDNVPSILTLAPPNSPSTMSTT